MKRILTALVVFLLVLAGCSTGDPSAGGTLTVANGEQLTGDFVSGFTNAGVDADVMDLIWDLPTYYVNPETGGIDHNPTVVDGEPTEEEDAEGNVTYTFKIKQGLKFSDGSAVTAKDYVFTALFRSLPGWLENAPYESNAWDLVGYDAFSTGETDVFEGVKLIDDYTFSLTIDAANLPYYYERSSVTLAPVPMAVWFPEAELNADGNGFTNTAAEIAAAVTYVQENERYMPTVVTGPYTLTSYENNIATLTKNDNYSGNYEGETAKIGTVVVKNLQDSLIVDAIINGEVDLTAQNIDKDDIQKALTENLNTHTYARNAYGKISLMTDRVPTNDKLVRQALAYVIDRQTFVEGITGGYGTVVDGPYGLAMPFYQARKEEIAASVHQYTYNPTVANDLLDQTDWKFEADGTTPFDPAKAETTSGYYRHNSAGEVLEIKHYATVEAAAVSDLVLSSIPPAAEKAGIKYEVTMGDWATMLTYVNRTSDSDYNAYNYATSYSALYDPYTAWHSRFTSTTNTTKLADAELDSLIEALRATEPGDTEAFNDAFAAYVIKWNDLIPEIPLYSNEVYDIATDRVQGLEKNTPTVDWAMNIVYLTLSE